MQTASNPCSNSPPGRSTQKILRWKNYHTGTSDFSVLKRILWNGLNMCVTFVNRWNFHPLSKVFIHNGDETHGSELWAREISFEVGHLVSEFLHPPSKEKQFLNDWLRYPAQLSNCSFVSNGYLQYHVSKLVANRGGSRPWKSLSPAHMPLKINSCHWRHIKDLG